jgi:dTDP-4-amino-4,6-dideoxygalactose transaminase
MEIKIPLYRISSDEEDVAAVSNVIKRGSYWSAGPEVECIEAEFAAFLGRKHALTFNSGSSALHALLIGFDFPPGSEIIVPSFTFVSSVNSILLAGYKPVFTDIEGIFYGVDPAKIGECFSSKTRAIMPTHYGGCPCRVGELREIAEQHGVALIEDSAESLSSEVIGEGMAGAFGDAAIFSLSGAKVITSGEGGVVVMDSDSLARRIRMIRSHGDINTNEEFNSTIARNYITLGCNWRMSDITAALALSQFRKIDRLVKARIENSAYLTRKLSRIPGIEPPVNHPNRRSIYQMYTIKCENNRMRDRLKAHLEAKGVNCKVYFEPIHRSVFYASVTRVPKSGLIATEDISSRVLTLPMFPSMTHGEMDYVAEKVGEYCRREGL